MTVIEPPGGTMYETNFPGALERAHSLLGLLGFPSDDGEWGRLRDAWMEHAGEGVWHLVVMTRCGGPNKADYPHVFEMAELCPSFISWADDDFDETYCRFRFKVEHPVESVEEAVMFEAAYERPLGFAPWEEAVRRWERGEFNEGELALARKIIDKFKGEQT